MSSIRAKTSHLFDRLLRPFSKIRPGEGVQAALLMVCVFLLLAAYYVLKTAREGLILSRGTFGLRGDELKTYATGLMALMLIGIVHVYDLLADRVRRIRLINISYAIVIGCLAVFFVLGRVGVPIGLVFFIWLGIVSVLLIAQFWSYANDLYTEEQGQRLFAIIATGGSVGAIFGPRIAALADTFTLMEIAAALLIACVLLFNAVDAAHRRRSPENGAATEPTSGAGGFSLILHDRYLLLIAGMLLLLNLVNTTGEYVLSSSVRERAFALIPDSSHANLFGAAREAAIDADRREWIKAFYSDFFMWVNLIAFVLQAFFVSRLIDRVGVRRALFVMPAIAFGAYLAIGMIGGLALVRVAKIAENTVDYSLQNTVRQTLFLRTSRAVKYKAKAAIDTFFMRAGDTLSAVLVGVGIHQLALGPRDLSLINVGLVIVWFAIAAAIAHDHRLIRSEPIAWANSTGSAGASA